MKSKHFAKKFGQACGDFDIVNNDGVDRFLVPIDWDYPLQTLLHWMHYKTTKIPKHFKIVAVHFHSSEEADSSLLKYFSEYCEKRSIEFHSKKVANPADRSEYLSLLVKTANEYNCNKVAVPDSIDFLNAQLITNMSLSGFFSCASINQKMRVSDGSPEVIVTRPFCYASDDDIQKYAIGSKFENNPSGIFLKEEIFMDVARKGIEMLISNYSNVRMNLFHSQYSIQQKYIGIGEDHELQEDANLLIP
ncbi:hypothetical protein TRFO_32433 [Tritrichomonas foetus]|uniref:Uncharacterized protein n=1 Tax=Tritrichomonas foetus TaxID=1144522 RepID=A0A1J4JQR5_9EUKA|nr:hypothetical protein TRFO_32433 [Tritrichomonas foetus]|eukprot:OHT00752.1 hypothetical protein TRFO_32433 [Tritrichomonas foetus]